VSGIVVVGNVVEIEVRGRLPIAGNLEGAVYGRVMVDIEVAGNCGKLDMKFGGIAKFGSLIPSAVREAVVGSEPRERDLFTAVVGGVEEGKTGMTGLARAVVVVVEGIIGRLGMIG